jgi:uncharacterized membrane protein YfcA
VSTTALIVLIVVFFLTSVIGVVTGSNSLIAVPAMFQAGVEPRVAVATNMFGLLFMAAGGSIPFIRQGRISYRKIWPMVALTIFSSAIGAALVGIISGDGIKIIVTVGMIAVAIFTLIRRNSGLEPGEQHSWTAMLTYVLVFVLGIYGGLFSGGYVTVLTAVCVGIAGMTYSEAVASTKIINVFSSGVATVVFMWQGLVDYRLGLILGITMFAGAYVGAHYATKLNDLWLRRVFLATILLLAVKTIYDLI